MKAKIQNLLEQVLKEAMISRDDILKAIEGKKEIVISKSNKDAVGVTSVIPLEIDDQNNILGQTKDGSEINFNLNNIVSFPRLIKEDLKIQKDTSGNATVTGLEDADVKTANAALGSVAPGKTLTIKEDEELPAQEQGLENLISWCEKLDLNLRNKKEIGNKIQFTAVINETPVNIFIDADGSISMGGQAINSEDELRRLMEFFKDIR